MNNRQVYKVLENVFEPDWWVDIENPVLQAACKELEEHKQAVLKLARAEQTGDDSA